MKKIFASDKSSKFTHFQKKYHANFSFEINYKLFLRKFTKLRSDNPVMIKFFKQYFRYNYTSCLSDSGRLYSPKLA